MNFERHPRIRRFLESPQQSRQELISKSADDDLLLGVIEELESLVRDDAHGATMVANEIESIAPRVGRGGMAARALRTQVAAESVLGKFPDAIKTARRARTYAQEAGNHVEAARALIAAMQPMCSTGKMDEALTNGTQARSELMSLDEPELAARADLNLANILKAQGRPAQAIVHLEQVLALLEDQDPIQPHALNALGECLTLDHQLDSAEQAYEKALGQLESQSFEAAVVIGNRAEIASRQGRFQTALAYFNEATSRCEALGIRPHLCRMKVEFAEVLESCGLFQDSHDSLLQTIPELEELELLQELATGRHALGRVQIKLGNSTAAVETLDGARKDFLALENVRCADRALLTSVEACIHEERLLEAATRLSIIDPAGEDLLIQAMRTFHHSLLAQADGNPVEALQHAEAAVRKADELGLRPLRNESKAWRAHLLLESGQRDRAITESIAVVQEINRIRGEFNSQRYRAAFLSNNRLAHQTAIRGLVAKGDPDSLATAFEITEQARNRGLIERLLQQLPDPALSPAEDPKISEMKRSLNALYKSLEQDGFREQRRSARSTRQYEIDVLEKKLESLIEVTQLSAPAIDHPLTFEEITSELPQDTLLIEYVLCADEFTVFTIGSGEISAQALPADPSELTELVAQLHFQCRRRLRGNVGPRIERSMYQTTLGILQELYNLLLRPIEKLVGEYSRVVVIPQGALSGIPFHALHDGDEFIIDRHDLSISASAAIAIRTASSPMRGCGTLIATVGDELAPSIDHEGVEVARMHSAHRPTLHLREDQATSDRIRQALSSVEFAHIACHARFMPDSPRSSGLKLHDRWFTIRDVHELLQTPPVVVLSGCETGLHPAEGADELLGLTRGFAAGGTRAVVASLWSVNDNTSTKLMSDMHSQLAGIHDIGSGAVTRSLCHAQRELRKQHEHPAFWAPFFCSEGIAHPFTQQLP